MMRKLCLILLSVLLLTGCAANVQEETASPEDAAVPSGVTAPSVLVPEDYSAADTAAMSTYMSANRWLIAGDRMYGLDYGENLRPVLASYRLRKGKPESFRILCEDCVPEYLALNEGFLYFIHAGSLQRLNIKSLERETLLDGPVGSLQIFDGSLYYTDGERRYCRADLEAQNREVLIDGPCDYAWAMPEGILFQSESEGACLRMRLWNGAERRLTAAASFAPLRLGQTVWYTQQDSIGSALGSIDLNDGTVTRWETPSLRGAAELIPVDGAWTLRVCLDGGSWKQQLLRPGESEGEACSYSGYRLCDWVGEALRIDAAYDPDGRLRCFVLVDEAGGELRFFGGQILE